MIKNTKLNFLLLLMICTIAMPSNAQQVNTKNVYIWTAACTALSIANYVASDHLLKKRKLTDDCVALLPQDRKNKYKLNRFLLHGARIMSVISGISSLGLTAYITKSKSNNNQIAQNLLALAMIPTMMWIAGIAVPGGLDYTGLQALQDDDIQNIVYGNSLPTPAALQILLKNGMDINGRYVTRNNIPLNLLQYLIHTFPYFGNYSPSNPDRNANRRQLIEYCLAQPQLDINAQDRNGNTALHYAIEKYDCASEALKLILTSDQLFTGQPRYPLKINRQNNDGNTPLHVAAKKMNLAAITMLLENDADATIINNQRETPAQLLENMVCNQPTARSLTLEQDRNLPIIRQLFIDAAAGRLRGHALKQSSRTVHI